VNYSEEYQQLIGCVLELNLTFKMAMMNYNKWEQEMKSSIEMVGN